MRGIKREELWEVNILRAIAFIFVILQHSLGSTALKPVEGNVELFFEGVLFTFAEAAVPIFLFISGLTLTYTYKDKLDLRKYYKNRILYLIVPYFVWSFVNIVIHSPEKLNNFFMETIAGNGMFHLWYMGMIIRMVLIFPIILYVGKFIAKRGRIVKVTSFIVMFFVCYIVAARQWVVEDFIVNLLFKEPTELQLRAVSLSFLFWAYYLFLGVYSGFNYKWFKKQIIKFRYIIYLVFISMFMYKLQIKYDAVEYNRIFCLLYRTANISFFLLLAIKILDYLKVKKLLNFIGKYSYASYMIHTTILYTILYVLKVLGIDNSIINGIMSCGLAAIITPYFIYRLSSFKYSRMIVGVKN